MRIGLGPFLPGMHLTASEAAQFATIIRKFGKYEQSRGGMGDLFFERDKSRAFQLGVGLDL